MFYLPGNPQHLGICNQLLEGRQGQNGGFWPRCRLQIGADHRDVPILVGEDLNLTVPNVTWQTGNTAELQRSAVKGMRRVSDSDAAFACLRDQRGITLGEVCPDRLRR